MNNKGFVRTLEAIIAVVIVLGIILALAPAKETQESATPTNVREAQSFILNHIATTEKLRTCIIRATAEGECRTICPDIDSFMQQKYIPPGYEYRCEICNSASTCSGALPLDKSLYTDSRFIATDPARVIRLVFWER